MKDAALLGAAVAVLFFGFFGTVLLGMRLDPAGQLPALLIVAGGWGSTAAVVAYLIKKATE